MSDPHDPWATGRPDETDRTVVRGTDGTYRRPQWRGHGNEDDPNGTQIRGARPDQVDRQSSPPVPAERYPPPNQYHPPGRSGPPNQYGPDQYGPDQYGPPDQHASPDQYLPPDRYGQPTAYAEAPRFPPSAPTGYQPYAGFGQYPPPAGPYPSAKKRRHRRPLIVGLCVLLVAALATGGWLVLRPSSSPAFTYSGKKIANADAVLSSAQRTTTALVSTRHGASAADTRCYFARATTPASGAKKSDIDDRVFCGPVLFVDGDRARTYLSFPLTAGATHNGATTLSVGTTPTSADPSAAPSGLALVRPDASTPPTTSSLAVPSPPPAPPGFYATRVDLSGQTIPAAPANAVIGSRDGGVRMTNLGLIVRYGHGDAARSAPTGQKLIAFRVAAGPTESGGAAAFAYGPLSVDVDGTTHTVPHATTPVVVAVPRAAKTADLVLDDAGVVQRISLLTGEPGPANIAVARRTHHDGTGSGPQNPTFTISSGTASVTRRAHANLIASQLRYWARDGDARHAASPTSALLYVDLLYSYTEALKKPFTGGSSIGPFGFDASLLSMRLPGGRVVRAHNYATEKDKLYILFPVPASFTSGTLIVSGRGPANKNGVRLGIKKAVTFTIRVAAN